MAWFAFRRGSQWVRYRSVKSASEISSKPPVHSVTFWPVISKWIPRIALVGLYGGSIWGSVKGIEFANREREIRYTKRVQTRYGPRLFLDFPEPVNLVIR